MSNKLFSSFSWRMAIIALTLTIGLGFSALAQDKQQCTAKTKAGKQCRISAMPGFPYCHIHDKNSPDKQRCGAKTKAGTPCKHIVKVSGDKCKQHQ